MRTHEIAAQGHAGRLAAEIARDLRTGSRPNSSLGDAVDVACALDILAPRVGEGGLHDIDPAFRDDVLQRAAILLCEDADAAAGE